MALNSEDEQETWRTALAAVDEIARGPEPFLRDMFGEDIPDYLMDTLAKVWLAGAIHGFGHAQKLISARAATQEIIKTLEQK